MESRPKAIVREPAARPAPRELPGMFWDGDFWGRERINPDPQPQKEEVRRS